MKRCWRFICVANKMDCLTQKEPRSFLITEDELPEREEYSEENEREAFLLKVIRHDFGEAKILARRARYIVDRLLSGINMLCRAGMHAQY